MRFLFYDNVIEIDKGKTIKGMKSFGLSEEFLRGHFRKLALVPGVIYIEAMAQLLGWLIIYSHDFNLSAIMTLIEGVKVPPLMRPGFTAHIEGEIITTTKSDSLGRARVVVDGVEVASLDRIIYGHFHGINRQEIISRFNYYSGLRVD